MVKKLGSMSFVLLFVLAFTAVSPAQFATLSEESVKSVVTILLAADGQANAVGSGLVVRSDGFILTPYSLVRDAREIQVKLSNGEIYDKAEIVSTDERRNVAVLRISAVNLSYIPNGTAEELQVGSKVALLMNPTGTTLIKRDLVLNSVQMADSVAGAGKGYRLLQFDAVPGVNPIGGLLMDTMGRSLGIVTTTPDVKGQNIAVPFSSIVGLFRSAPANNTTAVVSPVYAPTTVSAPAAAQTPYPIPQSSVLVPQRGVTPLTAKGPGSSVVKPSTVPEILAASKTIYVTSASATFKPDQMVNALNSRPEMNDWGMTFTDERELADLILEIDHVLFTYKYTFKLYSQRLGTVVATGSRIIWDGNLGAPYMADRFIEKVKAARGVVKKAPEVKKEETTDKRKTAT